MKKLFLILVLLTFINVNSQDLKREIKFTAISSENYFKGTNSVVIYTTLSSISEETKLAPIYQILNLKTDSSVVVSKLPKVKRLNYYLITKKLAITAPEWNQSNVDAFGFKLFLCLK